MALYFVTNHDGDLNNQDGRLPFEVVAIHLGPGESWTMLVDVFNADVETINRLYWKVDDIRPATPGLFSNEADGGDVWVFEDGTWGDPPDDEADR